MDTTTSHTIGPNTDEGYNDEEVEHTAPGPSEESWYLQYSPTKRREMAYELLTSLPRSHIADVHRNITRLLKIDIVGLLPTEISLKILSLLPATSLLTAAMVNKRWYCLANDQTAWRLLCLERGWEWKFTRRGWKGVSAFSETTATKKQRTSNEVDEGVGEEEDDGDAAVGGDRSATHSSDGKHPSMSSGTPDTSIGCNGSASSSTRSRHSSPCILPSPTPQSVPNYKLLYQTRALLALRLRNGSFRRMTLPVPFSTTEGGGSNSSSGTVPEGHTSTIYSVCLVTHPITGLPTLFTASRDTTILQWDLSTVSHPSPSQSIPYGSWTPWTPRPIRAFTGGHSASVLSICVVKSEGWLVSGGSDGRIIVWCMTTGDIVKEISGKDGHGDSVLCVTCDDKRIVSCSKDRTIRTYLVPSLAPHLILTSHRAAVNAVALSGTHIVSASGDRSLRVWDAETGKIRRVFEAHHTRGLASIAFVPPYVVTGSSDKHIRLFDLSTDRGWSTDPNPPPVVPSLQNLSITPTSTGRVGQADLSHFSTSTIGGTGLLPSTTISGPGSVTQASQFVTSGPSDTVSEGDLCEVCGGEGRRRTNIRRDGHTGLVRAVAMSEDVVVSGSYDESVKVWDRKTGSLIVDLEGGHDGRIFSVAFDCTKIVSCGEDHKICVWDLAWGLDTSFVKF